MSDDLDAVIREMWPGLRPGTKYVVHSERGDILYSAAWLDDQRLQAVPDKEEHMETFPLSSSQPQVAVPLSDGRSLADAFAVMAETVDGLGHIHPPHVHDLPISFFGRDDVENIDVLISEGQVHITGKLVIGGHKFGCFSEGFPMGAE